MPGPDFADRREDSPTSDRWRNDTTELAWAEVDPARLVAGANVGEKATNACGYCFGKQDGASDLGHDYEE